MANCSNCGCMGALRCVAGPMHHCPPPPPRPGDYDDFPFYSGPCPPCEGDRCRCHCRKCNRCHHDHCDHCHHDHCDRCHHDHCRHTRCGSAMFAADAPLSVDAGEAIALQPTICNPDCFEICEGCIVVKKSGLYHITWTANIPSYQCICSKIYLSLNGSEIAGSGQTICTQADNTSTSATGQALIQIPTNGLVCLRSGSDMCIGNGCSVDNIFTLTMMKAQ